jgi:hypothetical protein
MTEVRPPCVCYCSCPVSCRESCFDDNCRKRALSWTVSQATFSPSSTTTGLKTLTLEGGGKPSAALSTAIVSLVEEFLSGMEPTDAWHVTLKVTSSL